MSFYLFMDNTYFKQKHIQIVFLKEGYYAALNLMQDGGVVVLNEEAIKILNYCSKKRTTKEISNKFSYLDKGNILEVIAELENAKLIAPRILENQKPEKLDMLVVWMHTTNSCNLRCKYCYIHHKQSDMSINTGKRSVDCAFRVAKSENFKTVQFKLSGGEVTLREDFIFELVKYIRKRSKDSKIKAVITLLSNGITISDKLIELIRKKDIHLTISLDGNEYYHDKQRVFPNGEGSFKQVSKSIEKLVKNKVPPFISIVVTSKSVEGLPELIEYLLIKKLRFRINLFRENSCTVGQNDLNMDTKKIIKHLKSVYKVIEKNIPEYSLKSSLLDRVYLTDLHQYGCIVNRNYMVVDQKGGISQCQMEIEDFVTNIDCENPLEVLRKHKKGIRSVSVDQKKECSSCKWRYWCGGGCPKLCFIKGGSYESRSPYCEVYKTLLPEIIRLEGLRLLKTHTEQVK